MARGNVRVRPAHLDDVPALALLSERADATTRTVRRPAGGNATFRLEALLARADRIVLVAVDEQSDLPLGMAALYEEPISALHPVNGITVGNLLVGAEHRRRGVGRALIAAAVRHAEAEGIEDLVVAVRTEDRDTHRYLARLGFSSIVVRRAAPVASVRRALGLTEPSQLGALGQQRGMRRVLGRTARPSGRAVRWGA